MQLDTPIIIPAKSELVADKFLARRIVIEHLPEGRWSAAAELNFYSEDAGVKTFVLDEQGQRIRDWVNVADVLVAAGDVPELLQAFGALEVALEKTYNWQRVQALIQQARPLIEAANSSAGHASGYELSAREIAANATNAGELTPYLEAITTASNGALAANSAAASAYEQIKQSIRPTDAEPHIQILTQAKEQAEQYRAEAEAAFVQLSAAAIYPEPQPQP